MSRTRADFLFICLFIILSSLAPSVECINYSYPVPIFQWKSQSLSQCLAYSTPLQYSACSTKAGKIEVSRPPGKYMACTNDPATLFPCISPFSPGCKCNSIANVYACTSIKVDAQHSFSPQCLDTIFAVEGNGSLHSVCIVSW